MADKKPKECPAGAPLWMVTFSDMVTLLLTFFVLLLSMASLDRVKFSKANNSIKEAFGFHPVSPEIEYTIPVLPTPPKEKFAPVPQQIIKKAFDQIQIKINTAKINEKVELIRKDENSIIIRLNDSLLFAPEDPNLDPASYPLLRKIGDIIRPLPLSVRLEGHTDSTPIADPTMSNWDLSVYRAVSVMRFYNRGKLIATDRLSAVGYGADDPLLPNTTSENRAKNRRVDFVLNSNVLPTDGGQGDAVPF
ncbi:MAG: flagellar motor protein MotB [Desulfobulbaceae bacterium]|nr:flagellar motor protein MotB [Desulfobulbaceae bacterium]